MRASYFRATESWLVVSACCVVLSFPFAVRAQVTSGQSTQITRIAQVLWKPVVGQRVALRGRVIRANGADKYRFADDSGDITVVISSQLLSGQKISEYATVSIEGAVVVDFRSTPEILVERLTVEP
jgi:uncharacterized protein (TIGR00156 family)